MAEPQVANPCNLMLIDQLKDRAVVDPDGTGITFVQTVSRQCYPHSMSLRAFVLCLSFLLLHCAGPHSVAPSQQQGEPQPVAPIPSVPPSEPWPCAQEADVDGDGQVDRVELSLDHAMVRLQSGETVALPLLAATVVRLCLGNVDGEGNAEIVAGVIRPTTRDGTYRQRLFMYAVEGRSHRPRFLASGGGGELLHFGLQDVDEDGHVEILARERSNEGETTRVYRLDGYNLRERPELQSAAPTYGFHPPSFSGVRFSGAAERLQMFEVSPFSTKRLAAKARSVTVSKGLSNVANRGEYRWLKRAARQKIEQQGFVVLRPSNPPAEFHELYIENQYLGLPSFITSDTALHLTHLVFDDVLQDTEQHLLGPALARLVDGMSWQARELDGHVPPALAEPLAKVRLRLDMASTLLTGTTRGNIDGEAYSQMVAHELELLEGRVGTASSRLGVDYSTFVVRGHYTRTEALQRYFKAHLLLSTAGTSDPREAALMTALAMSDPTHRHLFGMLDGFARAFVGPPSNPTPLDLLVSAHERFGPSPALEQLDVDERWFDADPSRQGSGPGAISLLARRWPADNDIFMETPTRGDLPDTLELLASLGSKRARFLLTDQIGANAAIGTRLDSVAEGLRSGRIGDPHSLGGRWLLSLRWVLLPFDEGYPDFQRSTAWADHSLVTAAASWAELRRDTILYVQPPLVWAEGGDEDELPPGEAAYVEPVPELYRELSDMLDGLGRALSTLQGNADSATRARRQDTPTTLRRCRSLLGLLEAAARQELEGDGLTREQHEQLQATGEFLEATLAGGGNLRLDPVPVVADVVHLRDPEAEDETTMFTVATGPVDVIVVAVPLGRRTILARGPVSSFYQFESSSPMTDEQWRDLLERDEAPERPPWGRAVSGPAGPRRSSKRSLQPRRRTLD